MNLTWDATPLELVERRLARLRWFRAHPEFVSYATPALIAGMIRDLEAERAQLVEVPTRRMSEWVHAICDTCWGLWRPTQVPLRIIPAVEEVCCNCGELAIGGIYLRADPATMPCQGTTGHHLPMKESL